ncbi:hypothetical protein DFJ73DRAFT_18564 [Zopfochytrium polystomum]|nr:hypothetical protein DFJ73DRAFT_18564 [Zopfochytrium polystomum]
MMDEDDDEEEVGEQQGKDDDEEEEEDDEEDEDDALMQQAEEEHEAATLDGGLRTEENDVEHGQKEREQQEEQSLTGAARKAAAAVAGVAAAMSQAAAASCALFHGGGDGGDGGGGGCAVVGGNSSAACKVGPEPIKPKPKPKPKPKQQQQRWRRRRRQQQEQEQQQQQQQQHRQKEHVPKKQQILTRHITTAIAAATAAAAAAAAAAIASSNGSTATSTSTTIMTDRRRPGRGGERRGGDDLIDDDNDEDRDDDDDIDHDHYLDDDFNDDDHDHPPSPSRPSSPSPPARPASAAAVAVSAAKNGQRRGLHRPSLNNNKNIRAPSSLSSSLAAVPPDPVLQSPARGGALCSSAPRHGHAPMSPQIHVARRELGHRDQQPSSQARQDPHQHVAALGTAARKRSLPVTSTFLSEYTDDGADSVPPKKLRREEMIFKRPQSGPVPRPLARPPKVIVSPAVSSPAPFPRQLLSSRPSLIPRPTLKHPIHLQSNFLAPSGGPSSASSLPSGSSSKSRLHNHFPRHSDRQRYLAVDSELPREEAAPPASSMRRNGKERLFDPVDPAGDALAEDASPDAKTIDELRSQLARMIQQQFGMMQRQFGMVEQQVGMVEQQARLILHTLGLAGAQVAPIDDAADPTGLPPSLTGVWTPTASGGNSPTHGGRSQFRPHIPDDAMAAAAAAVTASAASSMAVGRLVEVLATRTPPRRRQMLRGRSVGTSPPPPPPPATPTRVRSVSVNRYSTASRAGNLAGNAPPRSQDDHEARRYASNEPLDIPRPSRASRTAYRPPSYEEEESKDDVTSTMPFTQEFPLREEREPEHETPAMPFTQEFPLREDQEPERDYRDDEMEYESDHFGSEPKEEAQPEPDGAPVPDRGNQEDGGDRDDFGVEHRGPEDWDENYEDTGNDYVPTTLGSQREDGNSKEDGVPANGFVKDDDDRTVVDSPFRAADSLSPAKATPKKNRRRTLPPWSSLRPQHNDLRVNRLTLAVREEGEVVGGEMDDEEDDSEVNDKTMVNGAFGWTNDDAKVKKAGHVLDGLPIDGSIVGDEDLPYSRWNEDEEEEEETNGGDVVNDSEGEPWGRICQREDEVDEDEGFQEPSDEWEKQSSQGTRMDRSDDCASQAEMDDEQAVTHRDIVGTDENEEMADGRCRMFLVHTEFADPLGLDDGDDDEHDEEQQQQQQFDRSVTRTPVRIDASELLQSSPLCRKAAGTPWDGAAFPQLSDTPTVLSKAPSLSACVTPKRRAAGGSRSGSGSHRRIVIKVTPDVRLRRGDMLVVTSQFRSNPRDDDSELDGGAEAGEGEEEEGDEDDDEENWQGSPMHRSRAAASARSESSPLASPSRRRGRRGLRKTTTAPGAGGALTTTTDARALCGGSFSRAMLLTIDNVEMIFRNFASLSVVVEAERVGRVRIQAPSSSAPAAASAGSSRRLREAAEAGYAAAEDEGKATLSGRVRRASTTAGGSRAMVVVAATAGGEDEEVGGVARAVRDAVRGETVVVGENAEQLVKALFG